MAPHQAQFLAAYDDPPASSSSATASHPSNESDALSRQSNIDSVDPIKSNDEDNEENEDNDHNNSVSVGNPREGTTRDGEECIPFSESVPRQQSFSILLKVPAQTSVKLSPLVLGAAATSESGHGYVHGVVNDENEGDDGTSGNGILFERTCNTQSTISLINASNRALVASPPPDLESTSDATEEKFNRRWFFVTSEILDSSTQAASLIGDGILRTNGSIKTTDPGLDPPTDSGNFTSGAIVKLGLTQVESSPVAIHMPKHKSAQWNIPSQSGEQGRLEIVLGFSFEDIELEDVHQLLIRIGTFKPHIEVIPYYTLKKLAGEGVGLIRLKLHETLEFDIKESDPISITVGAELVMLKCAENNAGRFLLHYAEYHVAKTVDWTLDSSVHIHKPYLWSLDLDHGIRTTVRSIAASGDGKTIAVLSDHEASGIRNSLLQLWEIKSISVCDTGDQSLSSAPMAPTPRALASLSLPLPFKYNKRQHYMSVSHDGSQISISSSRSDEGLAIYTYRQDSQYLELSENNRMFSDSNGRGEFSNEVPLFVCIEDDCAEICDAPHDKPWKSLRTIPFDGRRLLHYGVCDQYLALLFRDRVLVWNMKTARMVSALELLACEGDQISFGDCFLLYLCQTGSITSILVHTGTVLSTRLFQSDRIGAFTALKNPSSFVVVPRIQNGNRYEQGALLTGTNLTEKFRFAALSAHTLFSKEPSREEGLRALTFHGSRVDFIQPWEREVDPRKECSITCAAAHTSPLRATELAPLGMEVHINGHRLVLAVLSAVGASNLHSILLPTSWSPSRIRVKLLRICSKLVLTTDVLIVVWKLPTSFDGLPSLELIRSLSTSSSDDVLVNECKHGQIYFQSKNRGTDSKKLHRADEAISTKEAEFIIHHLTHLFYLSEPSSRSDIIRYIRHIRIDNMRSSGGAPYSMVGIICEAWTDQDRIRYQCLLQSLLASPLVPYVPIRYLGKWEERNPCEIILNRSTTSPKILGLFRIIVDYCFDMATREKNTRFLWPVTSCLGILTDGDFPHRDLAPLILRRLAFIPAPSKSFVLDHHVIARPPRFWLPFRRDHAPPLNKQKNPIFQLTHSAEQWRNAKAQDERFTRDLFVASFDMIWKKNRIIEPSELDTGPAGESSLIAQFPIFTAYIDSFHDLIDWFHGSIDWLYGSIDFNEKLKAHDITLHDLDNPAVEALIEYKWYHSFIYFTGSDAEIFHSRVPKIMFSRYELIRNTIGFKFWISRFLFWCIYQCTILYLIFHQIYGTQLPEDFNLFILTLLPATPLLVQELVRLMQAIKKKRLSIFNVIDIVVVSLPLLQLIGHKGSFDEHGFLLGGLSSPMMSISSFIVPAIAFQLFFDLRVNKGVCKFVTIIVQIIIDIRVFFIIFVVGNLAFATAIVHMIHGCLFPGSCKFPETEFPRNFMMALTSTFFFVAGRFDPISTEFDRGSWAFYIMMLFYLFFNIIIMVNVLIAMINAAFNSADRSWYLVWQMNRLGYLKKAENTHRLPRFMRQDDVFPDEIYYTLTPTQRRAYETRWREQDEKEVVDGFGWYGQSEYDEDMKRYGNDVSETDHEDLRANHPACQAEKVKTNQSSTTTGGSVKATRSVEGSDSSFEDKFAVLEAKIDHLIELLAGSGHDLTYSSRSKSQTNITIGHRG